MDLQNYCQNKVLKTTERIITCKEMSRSKAKARKDFYFLNAAGTARKATAG